MKSLEDTPKTPLLEGDPEANQEKMKSGLKKRFNAKSLFTKKEKVKLDSIYTVSEPKVMTMKLTADATAMGYAVFLKAEYLKLNLSAEQQSDVLVNSLIV